MFPHGELDITIHVTAAELANGTGPRLTITCRDCGGVLVDVLRPIDEHPRDSVREGLALAQLHGTAGCPGDRWTRSLFWAADALGIRDRVLDRLRAAGRIQ